MVFDVVLCVSAVLHGPLRPGEGIGTEQSVVSGRQLVDVRVFVVLGKHALLVLLFGIDALVGTESRQKKLLVKVHVYLPLRFTTNG